MAEISESGSVFDALAARQRSAQGQTLRQSQEEDDDRDERDKNRVSERSREERPQEARAENGQQVQRFNATEELQNTPTPSRVIDQSGNDLSNGSVAGTPDGGSQPLADPVQQRDQRVEARQGQQQVSRTEQRLQE